METPNYMTRTLIQTLSVRSSRSVGQPRISFVCLFCLFIFPGNKDCTPNVHNEHMIGLTANDNIGFHIIIVIISTQWSTVFSQNGNNYLTPRRCFWGAAVPRTLRSSGRAGTRVYVACFLFVGRFRFLLGRSTGPGKYPFVSFVIFHVESNALKIMFGDTLGP